MTLLALLPLIILFSAALLIMIVNSRVRTRTHGITALAALLLTLSVTLLLPAVVPNANASLRWSTLNDVRLALRVAPDDVAVLCVPLLLICGSVTAGSLMSVFGRGARAFGTVFAGLLVLIAGGIIAAWSDLGLGSLLGLGVAWLGATTMQQATTAHNREATFGGLPLLMLATVALSLGAAPQLANGSLAAGWWIVGTVVLIGAVPRWGTTPTAPLLIRAPVIALGLPLLGALLFVRYAVDAAATWPDRTATLVLIVGAIGLVIGAVNALVARRLGSVFGWQIVAQLSLIVITFGTAQPAAGPIAAGLLAHTLVTGTALALAIGQLERAAHIDLFAELPPLPQPLRRAGLAYGLAALSCAGMPPLLGYALRRVVFVLGQAAPPWVTPLLLAASTLLALSYLPTLAAFFRRPAFRSPLTAIDQRGGMWPLALMIALLLGGLVPDQIWQYVLGDPSVTSITPPNAATLISTGISAVLALALIGVVVRAGRRSAPTPYFAGGEPLDEEPGWPLPFTTLRRVLWFLILPERVRTRALPDRVQTQRQQLTDLRQALERRYYLAVVVVSLISVLLLATQ